MTHRSCWRLAMLGAFAALTASLAAPATAEDQCRAVDLQYGAIDLGWRGSGHDQPGLSGAPASMGVLSRCSVVGTVCGANADCGAGSCEPTCAPGGSSACELTGPLAPPRCVRSLEVCATDADCEPGGFCERFMAPPLPLVTRGVPMCVTAYTVDDITGTLDLVTGESEIDLPLQRWRVHLGSTLEAPCPACGTVDDQPKVGETFTCGAGSPNTGAACVVDAVSPLFGGTSYGCPPSSQANVSALGVAVAFGRITTATRVEQAVLPCGFPLSQAHPVVGTGNCLDDFSACSANADCLRCTDTLSVCAANADCGTGVACAEAPVQPVACGVYCHCGFCGGSDVDRPCFSDADCDSGVQCLPGVGGFGPTPQERNNNCVNLVCGEDGSELCCSGAGCINGETLGPTALTGTCSDAPFRRCVGDAECEATDSGRCEFRPRQCFEGLIARAGEPSPLTTRCVDEPLEPQCATNADCSVGECSVVCPRPVYGGLACVAPTASAGINSGAGIPGPIAIKFNGVATPPPTVPPATTTTSQTTTTSDATTTTDVTTTTLPGGCDLQPRFGCRIAGTSAVAIKNRANPDRNKLVWKWLAGEVTDQTDYADPTTGTPYALCIYDQAAGTPSLSAAVVVAPGAAWTDKDPNGYLYRDSAALADGVRLVRLRTGIDESARVVLKGRGQQLPLPTPVSDFRYFEQLPGVTIQLVTTNDRCWTTEFGEAGTRRNSANRFAATSP